MSDHARIAAEKIVPPTIADDRVPERLKASLAHIESERANVQAIIAQAIADATADLRTRLAALEGKWLEAGTRLSKSTRRKRNEWADGQADTLLDCACELNAAMENRE